MPPSARRLPKASVVVLATLLALAPPGSCSRRLAAAPAAEVNFAGRLEFDGTSKFSHVRVRKQGNVRSLLFVRDAGEEVLETQIDLRHPQALRFEYLRYFFASYLFKPEQREILIVGLGGGSMIHFCAAVDPQLKVDAVEIDPLVVEIADKYFGVRSTATVRIVVADGLKFIAETEKKYDAIYMDAFLKPSSDTDPTGAPLALRTQEFYRQLQTKLTPGGVVAFNLNPHPEMQADVRAIATAFPQTYVFQLPNRQGLVVIGSTDPQRATPTELLSRGKALDRDRRFDGLINLGQIAARVQR